MRRFWWWFRIGMLSLVFVGLGAYLFANTPWRRWLGVQVDFSKEIGEGDRLVAGIVRFREEHGLWPQYLEDVPEAEAGVPAYRWFYDVSRVNGVVPGLSTAAPAVAPRTHLGFDFVEAEAGWKVFGEVPTAVVRKGWPGGVRVAASMAGDVRKRMVAELDRRIDREPGEVEHWRGKAAVLLAMRQYGEVKKTIQEAAAELPESYWPRMARALMDMEGAEKAPASMEAFEAWVKGKPTMTRWYYVSVLERAMKREAQAAEAMKQAVALEVTVGPDDPNVAAYYLWDMGRWSLEVRRYDLTKAICDAWQGALEDGTLSDQSHIPMRAAAQLAEGEFGNAATTLALLKAGAPHWAKNVEGLRGAIEKSDKTFVYEPGSSPGPFECFPQPE